METMTKVKPEVGMGGTILMYTDRHAFTIEKVSKSGKTFYFRKDTAIRTDKNGQSENQSYRFERNTKNPLCMAKLHKNGRYYTNEVYGQGRCDTPVSIGERCEYYDYGF